MGCVYRCVCGFRDCGRLFDFVRVVFSVCVCMLDACYLFMCCGQFVCCGVHFVCWVLPSG